MTDEPTQGEQLPGGLALDEDAQLMLRFQQGEDAAFEQIVRRNLDTVHALVYRFLREPSMADDITQEVFLRIFRNARTYEPKAKFSTWLYRIVANLCFNVMRSRRRMRPVSLDQTFDEDETRRDVPSEEPGPDSALDQEELAQQVARAVDTLPENQKLAILLNKYENKNYEEIAAVMETTTMAVKSLLSRARENLREKLARYVEDK
jgi:RNA polymerase sigma-70 factor (ECF subfamily)